MSTLTTNEQINHAIVYFRSKYALATKEWIERELGQCLTESTPIHRTTSITEKLYRRFLDVDWSNSDFSRWCLPSLPPELNAKLFNRGKQTFTGRYLLQINQIIDISKPLPGSEECCDTFIDDNEEYDFGTLFKKRKTTLKKSEASFTWSTPPPSKRMFQLTLSDGHNECRAIEYQPIPALASTNLHHAKCLLIGPFDVFINTIFLKPANLTIVYSVPYSKSQAQIPIITQAELEEIFSSDFQFD